MTGEPLCPPAFVYVLVLSFPLSLLTPYFLELLKKNVLGLIILRNRSPSWQGKCSGRNGTVHLKSIRLVSPCPCSRQKTKWVGDPQGLSSSMPLPPKGSTASQNSITSWGSKCSNPRMSLSRAVFSHSIAPFFPAFLR